MQAPLPNVMRSICPDAIIAEDVTLGFGVRIYGNVTIHAGCKIGDFCVIGHPAKPADYSGKKVTIGSGSVIRSHTVIYEGSELGEGLETGHHVVIREGTVTGKNLRVGNFSDIEGACKIGDYCRFHGYVHVGRGSQIGHFVWLYSLVTLTNDPLPPSHIFEPVTIEDGAVVAVNVTVMPGARLGRGAYIVSGGSVAGSVPAAGVVKNGKVVCGVHALMSLKHGVKHPWMCHLETIFPPEAQPRLVELAKEVIADSKNLKINARG
jgi:UDP-3-O-[3-hydroxymyristoyl] glucosamine N-acyltransferase